MKEAEITPGTFVRGAKNGWLREVLYIGPGPLGRHAVYADEFGAGSCTLTSLARWAGHTAPRPADWVRRDHPLIDELRTMGALPEQDGVAPKIAFSKTLSDRVKALVLHAFRNTAIEDIHAGRWPESKTGDYSDVKVVFPGGEIPWNELSRISDEEMKALNIDHVNKLYTLMSAPQVQLRGPHGWNDAEPDDDLFIALAFAGAFGAQAQKEAMEKIRSVNNDDDSDSPQPRP